MPSRNSDPSRPDLAELALLFEGPQVLRGLTYNGNTCFSCPKASKSDIFCHICLLGFLFFTFPKGKLPHIFYNFPTGIEV